jgi:hypothetical protein
MNPLLHELPDPLRAAMLITGYALLPVTVYLAAQVVYALALGIWFSRRLESDGKITIPGWCLKVDRVMWIKSSCLYTPQTYANFPVRTLRFENNDTRSLR